MIQFIVANYEAIIAILIVLGNAAGWFVQYRNNKSQRELSEKKIQDELNGLQLKSVESIKNLFSEEREVFVEQIEMLKRSQSSVTKNNEKLARELDQEREKRRKDREEDRKKIQSLEEQLEIERRERKSEREIDRRKIEALQKENELLVKSNKELKTQLECEVAKIVALEKALDEREDRK